MLDYVVCVEGKDHPGRHLPSVDDTPQRGHHTRGVAVSAPGHPVCAGNLHRCKLPLDGAADATDSLGDRVALHIHCVTGLQGSSGMAQRIEEHHRGHGALEIFHHYESYVFKVGIQVAGKRTATLVTWLSSWWRSRRPPSPPVRRLRALRRGCPACCNRQEPQRRPRHPRQRLSQRESLGIHP